MKIVWLSLVGIEHIIIFPLQSVGTLFSPIVEGFSEQNNSLSDGKVFQRSHYSLFLPALGKELPDCYILVSLVGEYLHLFLFLICISLITNET